MNQGFELIGDWDQAQKILNAAPGDLRQALSKALSQEGLYLLNELRKNFRKVQPPNAASTVKQKGSSQTLVNSRDFYNSMQVVVESDGVFVGIPASVKARGKRGDSLVKLLDIHENGRVIVQQMTEKQRRFLHAMLGKNGGGGGGGGGGSGIIVIHIPARPFVRPTFEANTPDQISKRVLARLIHNLKIIPKK